MPQPDSSRSTWAASRATSAASAVTSAVRSLRRTGVYHGPPGTESCSMRRLIITSMSVSSPPCSGVENEMAMPSRPMRPVRPMRWT